jgi:transposase InsO family protein
VSHANARLTFHGRCELVRRVRFDGRPVAHVAREMGVSRACAHRWVARFDLEGWDGLHDRSSRPHSCPTRTSPAAEQSVLSAREQTRRGPAEISRLTGVPERTVTRVLRRHRVPRLVQLDPVTGAVIRASKSTAVRYERDRPGELIHMDVKKIGRIPEGGGWRAHGRAMGSTAAKKKARIGFDYVHSAIDDHSRLAYSEILPDEKGQTCAGFLARAAAWFQGQGIAGIEAVMTDNHWSYTKSNKMTEVLEAIDAKHITIKPHCPWQNGKVERYQRTLAHEWAYATTYLTNQQRSDALPTWQTIYNTRRAHTALDGQPPISRVVSPT